MRKLIKECAPWLNWKVAAIFAAAVVCIGFIAGADVGLLAVVGATPLLAIAACLVPCLLPLAFIRNKRKTPSDAPQSGAECDCGSDACSIGDGHDSCQSKIVVVAEKHV